MHEDADPIPRDGRRRKVCCFSSGHGDVGLARFDHLDRFRIGVPDDIEVGSRVGFFECAGEEFDGRQLWSVAGDGEVPGHLRIGDEDHSRAEQKAET